MRRQDILHMCLQNLARRKSRTFLTVLGVLIGCCSIIIMVSIGIGMKESQEALLAQMGDLTIITVSAPQGGSGKAKLDDAAIASFKKIGGVTAVTPKLTLDNYSIKLTAGIGGRYVADWATVVGMDPDALSSLGYATLSGGSLSKSGDVLVGQYLAYDFRDTMRPDGMNTVDRYGGDWDENGNQTNVPAPYFDAAAGDITLQVTVGDNSSFSVTLHPTGTLKEDSSKGYETSDGLILSLNDLRALLEKAQGSNKKPITYQTALVKVSDISGVEGAENAIKAMGYDTSSMESIRKPMEKEARQKQLMLGGLGAISLFVAALGITNTMIMSISERTREIGVMKALGCYVRDIRVMFLSEAGAIGLLGGLVGCAVSFLISLIINLVSLGPPTWTNLVAAVTGAGVTRVSVIPPWLYLFSIVFAICIGLGSGYYPANKAVKIPALEAIKSET